MSHYSVIQTQIVSSKHLIRALRDLGYGDVEVHKTPQPLVGWMGFGRETTANLIIRKKYLTAASNDIGFRQGADGRFTAAISDFDEKAGFNAEWLQRLNQRYAYHVAVDLLDQQDFTRVEEEQDADGTIRMTVRRMA